MLYKINTHKKVTNVNPKYSFHFISVILSLLISFVGGKLAKQEKQWRHNVIEVVTQ